MNHMINRPPGRPGPGRQRGAVLLFAALGISALIVMASLIDLGLLYQYRREYQKTADLAALAGAAKLTELGCTDAAEAARQNVEQNLVPTKFLLSQNVKTNNGPSLGSTDHFWSFIS